MIPPRIFLKVYKWTLSPIFAIFGAQCRYAPTCSEYATKSVERFGLWRGGWLGLARLLRCRPGGACGIDPVPEQLPSVPWWAPWRYGDWRGPRSEGID